MKKLLALTAIAAGYGAVKAYRKYRMNQTGTGADTQATDTTANLADGMGTRTNTGTAATARSNGAQSH